MKNKNYWFGSAIVFAIIGVLIAVFWNSFLVILVCERSLGAICAVSIISKNLLVDIIFGIIGFIVGAVLGGMYRGVKKIVEPKKLTPQQAMLERVKASMVKMDAGKIKEEKEDELK